AELKDQITYLPDNADRSVAKQKVQNHQLAHLQ
ncbi:IS903D transposase, partial [Klebsiella pneumoniae subsp. pneumoniae KPNIH12]